MRRQLRELDLALQAVRTPGVIIGADTNARSVLWHSDRTDERGRKLEEFASRRGLNIQNKISESPTFQGPRGSSNIDVTLAGRLANAKIDDWKVIGDATNSDHNLILFHVKETRGRTGSLKPLLRRFQMVTARLGLLRKKIRDNVEQGEAIEPTDGNSLDTAVDTLTRAVEDACAHTMGTIKPKFRAASWWNRRLTTLKKSCHQLRKRMQRTPHGNERARKAEEYRRAKEEYKKEVVKAKYKSWKEFVETTAKKDIWQLARTIAKSGTTTREITSTSTRWGTTSWEEVADHFLGHFLKKDNPAEDSTEQAAMRLTSQHPPGTRNAREVSPKEVEAIIADLKCRTTPGLDLVEAEAVKAAKDTLAPVLAKIFNACLAAGIFPSAWKSARIITLLKNADGARGDPASYRPICLLSAFSKMLEQVLKERIMETVELHSHQYGFTRGKNTTDALEHLIESVKGAPEKYVAIIMVDIAAAFDSLWWPHVLSCLQEQECPQDVFRVIQDYFHNREVVMVDATSRRSRIQERGCPQGSVLGPTLWNLAFDGLIRKLRHNTSSIPVAYADDLAVLTKGNSVAELESEAQRSLDTILDWCRDHKLTVSAKKTVGLLAKGYLKPIDLPKVTNREGVPLEFKDRVKYLGVWINRGTTFRTHYTEASEKAKSSLSRFRAVARANWGLGGKELLTMYKAVFIPTLTYAAGAWGKRINKTGLAKLSSAQRAALITVTRAYRTVSGPAMIMVAGVRPVEHDIQQAILAHEYRNNRAATIDGHVYDPRLLGRKMALEQLQDRQQGALQETWDLETRGRTTYLHFPSVKERRSAAWIDPGYYLTQYLTGHGNFRAKLRKFSLVRSPRCKCGQMDTAHHTFNECLELEPIRKKYKDALAGIGIKWPITPKEGVSEAAYSCTATFVKELLRHKETWDRPP